MMTLEIQGMSERRRSPRYEIDLLADIVLDSGEVLTACTRNISSTGLQLICDSWSTDQIEPRGIQNYALTHLEFKVIIDLPIADIAEKLYANCRILSFQRQSQDTYMLNLVFIGYENNSENVLDKFLEQHLDNKAVITAFA